MIQTTENASIVHWQKPAQPRYEFQAVAIPDDDDGGFSISAIHYPGVISEGDTLSEAVKNVAEAFLAMLESRQSHGESMMYSEIPVTEFTGKAQIVRIVVDG
ncbi:hypothetical protein CKO51_05750 [Rhodopirellula sp. SM50]|nr:type II toxin-antitoxin system HicB family antitoxin [Rhodopirellula sp. SM50]PAY20548.1 hypothetical protein CKO51_05750 [Rhodopirellula sp. SM50]